MRLVGRRHNLKWAVRTVLALVFIGVGLCFLTLDPASGRGLVAGGFCLAAGFLLIPILWRGWTHDPIMLTIDQDGVFDRRSTDRPIPWAEIKSARIIRIRFRRFIYLDVGQPFDRFTTSPLRRLTIWLNRPFGPGLHINTHGMDVSLEAVWAALEDRLGRRAGR